MFEINCKLISYIIDDTRHFIHKNNLIELVIGRIGLIELGIGMIKLGIGLIEFGIGLIELGKVLMGLGICVMELRIGRRINNARRTVLARVSGPVFLCSTSASQEAFLVRDNCVFNWPLGRSLRSFSCTAHSAHSLCSLAL